jgi:aminopeptidase
MTDPRLETLSSNLVNYSCAVKPGENVLIEMFGDHMDFVRALVRETVKAGGQPYVWLRDKRVLREIIVGQTDDQLKLWAENDTALMEKMACYIGVRGGNNASEYAGVPQEKMTRFMRLYNEPVHSRTRVPKTRWVVLRYPSEGMAQQAAMSTDDFEQYYFNVCCLDYKKMSRAMDALVALMSRTERVRLTAPGTDLSFQIKGLPVIKCDGKLNIPDGEVFTAPLKGTVNGTIAYNTPSLYNGFTFENIRFTFKNGKIVEASANDTELVNKILDTDPGARYIGEFAIGVNPYVTRPMKDTLFDEKISGSFHFTPGNAYDDCFNGNRSAIHWDLVLIQTAEWGGGDMYFDDVLVRHDGRFVLPELECLNPENLM